MNFTFKGGPINSFIGPLPPLQKRTLEEANRSRRAILEKVYEVHPASLDAGQIDLDVTKPPGRANLSDIDYLNEAGFLEVYSFKGSNLPCPWPITLKLTHAGLDLLSDDKNLSDRLPIVQVSHVGGDVIIGDRNITRQTTRISTSLIAYRDSLAEKTDRSNEEEGILDHLNALLSSPVFNTTWGAFLASVLPH